MKTKAWLILVLIPLAASAWAGDTSLSRRAFGIKMPGWGSKSVAEFRHELGEIGNAASEEGSRMASDSVKCGITMGGLQVDASDDVTVFADLSCQGPSWAVNQLHLKKLIEEGLGKRFPYHFFTDIPIGGAGTIHN